ncbi:MAG: signal peptidase II [Candidatus Doudnabacteria bacterium]
MKNIKEKIIYSFLFFLSFFLDQATKHFVFKKQSALIFKNENFAFSLRIPTPLMYLTYIVLLTLLTNWFVKKQNKNILDKFGFVLILSGAVSNISERLFNGFVIDFIHIHTGVFNLADFFIMLGIILLFFSKDELINS